MLIGSHIFYAWVCTLAESCVSICVCARKLCECLHLPFTFFYGDGLCDGRMALYLGEDGEYSHSLTLR